MPFYYFVALFFIILAMPVFYFWYKGKSKVSGMELIIKIVGAISYVIIASLIVIISKAANENKLVDVFMPIIFMSTFIFFGLAGIVAPIVGFYYYFTTGKLIIGNEPEYIEGSKKYQAFVLYVLAFIVGVFLCSYVGWAIFHLAN